MRDRKKSYQNNSVIIHIYIPKETKYCDYKKDNSIQLPQKKSPKIKSSEVEETVWMLKTTYTPKELNLITSTKMSKNLIMKEILEYPEIP